MTRKLLLSLSLLLVAASFTSAAFACLGCVQRDDGTWYCQAGYSNGGDYCVIGGNRRPCTLYFTCYCPSCSPCPPTGCPAKLEKPSEFKHCKLVKKGKIKDAGMTDEEKLQAFLKKVDSGEFSGPTLKVYMDARSSIGKALITQIPADHWNRWAVGSELINGKSVKFYELTTKGGKFVHITILE